MIIIIKLNKLIFGFQKKIIYEVIIEDNGSKSRQ